MKNFLLVFACLAAVLLGADRVIAQQQAPPNIVFFITDDYGWQDTSEPMWKERTKFNDRFRTPNMEKLAARGVKFTTAYTACSVCSASRISVLTGQHPVRHGTTFIVSTPGRNTKTMRSAEQDNDGIQKEDVLLPALLREAGYRTICIGKAHFGRAGTFGADPLNLGFDRKHYATHSGSPIGNGSDRYHVTRDGKDVHLSEALTIEAKVEISAAVQDDKPFFLYLSHYAVHTPILEDKRFSENYPDLTGRARAYATLVEGADKSLGDIMTHLDELGIGKNTLIIWTADNGGYTGRGASSPYGNPLQTANWPLFFGKNDAYEGGHRVPTIIAWGAQDATQASQQRLPLKPGRVEERPFIHHDWMPTLLKLAGAEHPDPDQLDGYDITDLLSGKADQERPARFIWHEPNFWAHSGPESTIRDGRWKLIYFYAHQRWELFDLTEDIGERNNLLSKHPDVAERLADDLIDWLEDYGAKYPTDLKTGKELAPTRSIHGI
jgi:arylsulfatase A-like enzyme